MSDTPLEIRLIRKVQYLTAALNRIENMKPIFLSGKTNYPETIKKIKKIASEAQS